MGRGVPRKMTRRKGSEADGRDRSVRERERGRSEKRRDEREPSDFDWTVQNDLLVRTSERFNEIVPFDFDRTVYEEREARRFASRPILIGRCLREEGAAWAKRAGRNWTARERGNGLGEIGPKE